MIGFSFFPTGKAAKSSSKASSENTTLLLIGSEAALTPPPKAKKAAAEAHNAPLSELLQLSAEHQSGARVSDMFTCELLFLAALRQRLDLSSNLWI